MKKAYFKKLMSMIAVIAIFIAPAPLFAQETSASEAPTDNEALTGSEAPSVCEVPLTKSNENDTFCGERKAEFEKAREDLIKDLGLSPEQQEKLSKDREEHRNKMKESMARMHELREQLRQELEKYQQDDNKINAIATEMKAIESQLIDARIAKILSIKSILTQEQYEKFQEKMKVRWGEKGKGRFGKKTHGRWDHEENSSSSSDTI